MAVQGAAAQGPHAHWLWRQGGLREAWRGGCRQTDGRGWPDRQRFVMVFELNITRQNLQFNSPSTTFTLSSLPGCFPTVVLHTQPLLNLSASPRSASLLDPV